MLDISIVIPVYNKENFISKCLDSATSQNFPHNRYEILCVNDGSTDNSISIVHQYMKEHPNITVINKSNGGVSSARNAGIEKARGRYILFLDADDSISENTIRDLVTFFDSVVEEVDIVTYNIYYTNNGKHIKGKRGENINKNCIIDVTKEIDFSQTTINICIKNTKKVYFDESFAMYEDQMFNALNISSTAKIGWCNTAKYYYNKDGSDTTIINHPYFSYPSILKFFNMLLTLGKENKNMDEYCKSLILYNLNWRIKGDTFFPYHSNGGKETLDEPMQNIIDAIDSRLILKNKWLRNEHKFYLIWLKRKERPFLILDDNKWWLCDQYGSLAQGNNVSMAVVRERIVKNKFTLMGYLKSPMFLFSDEQPKLFLNINNKQQSIPLYDSANSRFVSKIKVCQFWGFELSIDVSMGDKINFDVELEGKRYPVSYWFCAWNNINHTTRSFVHYTKPISIEFLNNTLIFKKYEDIKDKQQHKLMEMWKVHKGKFLLWKLASFLKRFPIWLYSDFFNTFDNAYFQFKHDIKKRDGIFRFYIYFDDRKKVKKMFTPYERLHLVKFKGFFHRLLFIASKKILTSFSAVEQFVPYTKAFKYYNDLIDFETIYLQHGVMHIDCDINFAKDRHPFCDKIVASTQFEVDYFKEKLHYQDGNIIKTGIPRFEKRDYSTNKNNNKILLALSWRRYLVTKNGNYWQPKDNFKNFSYFINTMKILTSPRLKKFLKEKNFYLDVKLHPIFSMYKDYFQIESDNIHLKDTINEGDYKCLITDFSSFLFDFLYRNIPVVHFIPDEEEVKSGMHSYKSFIRPLTEDGPIVHTDNELISELEKIINSGANKNLSSCFLPHKSNICEDIYQHIVKN